MTALVCFNFPTEKVQRCDVIPNADKGRQKREGKTGEIGEDGREKGRQKREEKTEERS